MIRIKTFIFNSFQVNTYVLYDASGKCVIVDSGCYTSDEQNILIDFITKKNLKPEVLLNTHCHIDHIFGNKFIKDLYNVRLECHKDDMFLIENVINYANIYGFNMQPSPKPDIFINENDCISFGNSVLNILHVPGHSPGSLAFYNKEQKFVLTGDVLFNGSIGRTDLQKGNYNQLLESINTKLLPLGDTFTVSPGHGDPTTIGSEKKSNPFLLNLP